MDAGLSLSRYYLVDSSQSFMITYFHTLYRIAMYALSVLVGIVFITGFLLLAYVVFVPVHHAEYTGTVVERTRSLPRDIPVHYTPSFHKRGSWVPFPTRTEPPEYLYTVMLSDGERIVIDTDRTSAPLSEPTATVGDTVSVTRSWRSVGLWPHTDLQTTMKRALDSEAMPALSLTYFETTPGAAGSSQSWEYRLDTDV
jgi:hypothetical protein